MKRLPDFENSSRRIDGVSGPGYAKLTNRRRNDSLLHRTSDPRDPFVGQPAGPIDRVGRPRPRARKKRKHVLPNNGPVARHPAERLNPSQRRLRAEGRKHGKPFHVLPGSQIVVPVGNTDGAARTMAATSPNQCPANQIPQAALHPGQFDKIHVGFLR